MGGGGGGQASCDTFSPKYMPCMQQLKKFVKYYSSGKGTIQGYFTCTTMALVRNIRDRGNFTPNIDSAHFFRWCI